MVSLLRALHHGQIRQCIIDVWEHEPHISLPLLERCYIATPHIAGYSADGKANATRMSLEALARHFRLDKVPPITALPPTASSVQAAVQANTKAEALLHIYNPHRDSQALKHSIFLF